jgi:hypothetical protein
MTVKTNEIVYVHPSSFLFGQHEEYIVYRELVQTKKTYMKGVTAIHPSWLCSLGTALCHFSKPLDTPPPRCVTDSRLWLLMRATLIAGPSPHTTDACTQIRRPV